MTIIPDRLDAGLPYPLGATFDGLGVNFAVFSANAERIQLCLFEQTGRREIARIDLPQCTDEVWHGYLPGAYDGLLYGFRAHGPYAPQDGHRFNPNKLLLDPYAKGLAGAVRWTDALFGYRVNSPRHDLSFDRRDSAPAMPKAVVVSSSFDWQDDKPLNTPWSDTVIYEVHVRGLTKLLSDVRPPEQGTFAALADPAVIQHFQRLGVTAVELLPIHAYVQDRFLQEKGLTNYWGYNTQSFFAPEPRYMASQDLNELRLAIRRLHAAGLEVLLDVVYNHTAEGSEQGPTMSFRGLDHASYYRLVEGQPRYCVNDTGTGNTLNTSHPRVLQMVADSLRYWVEEFHVDGFRFDLGMTLGRSPGGFDPSHGFFQVLRQDPVLSKVKLIAEPWDVGPGGYQLGAFPPGFSEWNDKFRDGVRRYWRGDPGMRPELAARLAGSADLFNRRKRRPWASINFLSSHDGFTLNDTVSYEHRHNEANGEDNRDGHSENYSDNWGVEGETEDAGIQIVRDKVRRSMLVSLFTSLGAPMLLGGDEFGRTQKGNNNAYCQDDELSWFDWDLIRSPEGGALTDFIARLIRLRREHPVLACKDFLHGDKELIPGVREIDWFDERGANLSPDDWRNPEGRALVMRRAVRVPGGVQVATLLMNGGGTPMSFRLPPPTDFKRVVMLDSADPGVSERDMQGDDVYEVQDRAAVLMIGLAKAS
ncbi:glycogen debranching protein GlgX [Caulobacter sp. S45]|uniref:glycogen debranching protein GlgX n=1 Tax=Caulobacter sp. S45 TaxID=1641861 RepID=UPI00131D6BE0|nr:glycogen debranching protein GlgX [Caulobacter sp. S45]